MLERYGRVAKAIYPFRLILYAGILAGLGFFVYAIVSDAGQAQETRMFLPLLVVCWCVCLAMFTHGFVGTFPRAVASDGWIRRAIVAVIRGFWHVVALGVVAFGCATLLLTVRGIFMFGS